MKKKKSLWSGVSILIVAVLAITAFIRGGAQLWLLAAAFTAWSVWAVVYFLVPYIKEQLHRYEAKRIRRKCEKQDAEKPQFTVPEVSDSVTRVLLRHVNYGGVFHQNDRGGSFSIIYSYDPIEKHPVYADTVGQYTGVKDRNGTKIFEGDIVDISREEERGVIKWDEDTARFIILSDNISADFDNYWGKDLEVIGNIYDNQDLCDDIMRGGI